jgi:hypothetical protein
VTACPHWFQDVHVHLVAACPNGIRGVLSRLQGIQLRRGHRSAVRTTGRKTPTTDSTQTRLQVRRGQNQTLRSGRLAIVRLVLMYSESIRGHIASAVRRHSRRSQEILCALHICLRVSIYGGGAVDDGVGFPSIVFGSISSVLVPSRSKRLA